VSHDHHHHAQQLTLGISFFLGAVHAIEPGHGKTAMFVWMLQGRRSLWYPVVMGLSSAAAHSASLFLIATLVHFTQHALSSDHSHENQVSLALQWLSSLLVIAVGLNMLRHATTRRQTCCGPHQHQPHPVADADCCNAPRTPHHEVLTVVTLNIPGDQANSTNMSRDGLRTTTLLGVAVGLMPCPTALAACFAGLSQRSLWSTLLTVGLFAAGIAVSLSVTGLILQLCGHWAQHRLAATSRLPWAGIRAALILLTGLFCVWKLL